MKILFKYPTRARFGWFKKTLQTYYDMLSDKADFEFVITCDSDDDDMMQHSALNFMEEFRFLRYFFGNHKSKIEACNANVPTTPWDILVLVSDDMIPIVKDFDKRIVKDMIQYFPDTDGCLFYDDGLFSKDNTCTLSIIGRKYYERFGCVYHPDYKSFCCDNEFTLVARALGKMQYIPDVIIKHEWSGGPRSEDALYRRNSAMGKLDEATFARRRARNFDLKGDYVFPER